MTKRISLAIEFAFYSGAAALLTLQFEALARVLN
jgi:hypothetical protein